MPTKTKQSETQKIPKLRFSGFCGEWEEKKLGEVTKINQGLQIPISERFLEKVENSYFYITNEFLKENSQKEYYIKNPSESVLCDKNDILMTRTGNTGHVVTGVAGAFHNNFFKIKFNKIELEKFFLYCFLVLPKTKNFILRLAGTSTIPDLNHGDFYKIKINFPSLLEQQKIAEFLGATDEWIENLRAQKESLESYKKGMMQKIFAQEIRFKDDKGKNFPKWEEERLGEVFNITAGKTKSKYINEIGKNIIVDMGGISSDGKLIANKHTSHSKDFLTTNDLVMPKDDIGGGFIIGRVAGIPVNNKYICGDHIFKLTKQQGCTEYLFYAVNSFKISRSLRKKANGTAQLGLSRGNVDNQAIPFPSILEQQKIADFLTSLDNLINLKQQQITQAEEWKKGLMQGLFV